MVKHGNNPRGKSDKHQAHNKKYASTHLEATLERWFERITKPKLVKPKKEKRNVCNSQIDLDKVKEIKEQKTVFKRGEKETSVYKRKIVFMKKHMAN